MKFISHYKKILVLLSEKEKKQSILLILSMGLTGLLEFCGIGLVIPLINLLSIDDIKDANPLIVRIYEMLGFPEKVNFIAIFFLLLILVFALKNFLLISFYWFQTKFAIDVNKRISQKLYGDYLSQPYNFHLNKNTAEIIRNTTTEVFEFSYRVLMTSFILISEVIVIIFISICLFWIKPLATLSIFGILLLIVTCFYSSIKNKLGLWGKSRQVQEGLRLLHLQQAFGAVKEVKMHNAESHFQNAYEKSNTQLAKEWAKIIFFSHVPRYFVEFIAITLLVIYAIFLLLLGYENTFLISTFGLFTAAAFRLIPSANRCISSVQTLKVGIASLDLISNEFNNLKKESTNSKNYKLFSTTLKNKIRVNNLAYKHPNTNTKIISNLSFEILKGESIGIIGESGVGKSTLIDLLLGLHKPLTGEILVDDTDIANIIHSWRSVIGYVPQSVYIMDCSLRENIAFGLPKNEINDEKIWKVLREATLDTFAESLSEGLDTLMGERGARISGGQCQRIGISRALYRNPDILIFDEATSALDNKTETEFMETVYNLMREKTVIIVAHRLSTIKHCGKILHLFPECKYKFMENKDKSNPIFT